MAIFKRLENYLKDANFLIFSSITSCIDGKSFSMSFGSKIFTDTDLQQVKVENAKKKLFYEVKVERSNNSFRSSPIWPINR